MDLHTQKFKIRLGLFVAGGLALFVLVGNNIRFSGINVGTVENIAIINDTTAESI
jgi:phospholipid/cholesterol/gamma-HCH transport system substrate-binding protein